MARSSYVVHLPNHVPLLIRPAILIHLVQNPIVSQYDLSSVKQLIYGAAPVSQEIIVELKKRFPHFRPRNSWGMTEVTGAGTVLPEEYQDWDYAHMTGKTMAGMQLKVVDSLTGKELGTNENGEVSLRLWPGRNCRALLIRSLTD